MLVSMEVFNEISPTFPNSAPTFTMDYSIPIFNLAAAAVV